MNKFFKGAMPRIFLIVSTILLQIGFWIALIYLMGDYSGWSFAILLLLGFLCVIYILIQDIYSEVKITWIILILLFPVVGTLSYLFFNGQLARKKVKNAQQKMESQLKLGMSLGIESEVEQHFEENFAKRQSNYLEHIANSPAHTNTELTYFKVGDDMLDTFLNELKKAEKYIFLEFFIIDEGKVWSEIEEILIQKAQDGVDVRITYDYFASLFTLPFNFSKRLNDKKIKCYAFNPYTHFFSASYNNRDHRKICVIDGEVGFTGGINLADEYFNIVKKYGHWKDNGIMLKGDAVYNLTVMFLSMWESLEDCVENFSTYFPIKKYKTDGVVQPFYDNPMDGEAVGETVYMSMLNQAENYVYITSPYLIISREMMVSLTSAAKSGIDVRLILPGIPDKKIVHFLSRSYYVDLVKSGVKIYEYTPGFIHSKMFICDDISAVIGTINLDYRSLMLHYECGVWLYKSAVIDDMKKDFLETQMNCIQITQEDIETRKKTKFGFVEFVTLGVLRSFAPLL